MHPAVFGEIFFQTMMAPFVIFTNGLVVWLESSLERLQTYIGGGIKESEKGANRTLGDWQWFSRYKEGWSKWKMNWEQWSVGYSPTVRYSAPYLVHGLISYTMLTKYHSFSLLAFLNLTASWIMGQGSILNPTNQDLSVLIVESAHIHPRIFRRHATCKKALLIVFFGN